MFRIFIILNLISFSFTQTLQSVSVRVENPNDVVLNTLWRDLQKTGPAKCVDGLLDYLNPTIQNLTGYNGQFSAECWVFFNDEIDEFNCDFNLTEKPVIRSGSGSVPGVVLPDYLTEQRRQSNILLSKISADWRRAKKNQERVNHLWLRATHPCTESVTHSSTETHSNTLSSYTHSWSQTFSNMLEKTQSLVTSLTGSASRSVTQSHSHSASIPPPPSVTVELTRSHTEEATPSHTNDKSVSVTRSSASPTSSVEASHTQSHTPTSSRSVSSSYTSVSITSSQTQTPSRTDDRTVSHTQSHTLTSSRSDSLTHAAMSETASHADDRTVSHTRSVSSTHLPTLSGEDPLTDSVSRTLSRTRTPSTYYIASDWALWNRSTGVYEDSARQSGRYVEDVPGVITDTYTNLQWQKATDATQRNWQDAQTYCETLSLGGFDDWMVPSAEALDTISDYTVYSAFRIDTTAFPGTMAQYYQSSTLQDGVPFKVNFFASSLGGAAVWSSDFTQTMYVRCVRRPYVPLVFTRYDLSIPGQVTDNVTGLIWQQGLSAPSNWSSAKSSCNSLSLNGSSSWRLPTVKELRTLVDPTITGAGTFTGLIDSTAFPGTQAKYFWAASAVRLADNSLSPWCVDFGTGNSITCAGLSFYHRCVH